MIARWVGFVLSGNSSTTPRKCLARCFFYRLISLMSWYGQFQCQDVFLTWVATVCPGLQPTAWKCGSSTNTMGLKHWVAPRRCIYFSQTVRCMKQSLVIYFAPIISVPTGSSCSDSSTAMVGKLARLLITTTAKVPVITPEK